MIEFTLRYRTAMFILLVVSAGWPLACGERKNSVRKEQWRHLEVKECSDPELGERKVRLIAAFDESIGTSRAEKKEENRDRRYPDYELRDVRYYRTRIDNEVLLVAVAGFEEIGVPHVSEVDVQVTAALWKDRVSVIDIAEGAEGLGPDEPVRLFRLGEREGIRLMVIHQGPNHQITTATAIAIADFDLNTGGYSDLVRIEASEHDCRTPVNLDIATGDRITITATHPDNGKDPLADLWAESKCPLVKIEQLRRSSVRVILP